MTCSPYLDQPLLSVSNRAIRFAVQGNKARFAGDLSEAKRCLALAERLVATKVRVGLAIGKDAL